MAEKVNLKDEVRSKYKLGKLTNKYIIIDIYSFAYLSREEAIYRII